MVVSFLKNTKLKKLYMNEAAILEQLKKIIMPFVNNEEAFDSFSEDTDFIKDLNINSANLVDIILDVEDAFDIQIDNESMEKMLDVKSTLEIIRTKLSEK
jgi:acyl carrier protein